MPKKKQTIKKQQNPRIKKTNAPVSPFVIKLSRDEKEAVNIAEEKLAKLAEQFILDDFTIENEENEEDLIVDFNDLARQVHETEQETAMPTVKLNSTSSIPTLNAPSTKFHTLAMPDIYDCIADEQDITEPVKEIFIDNSVPVFHIIQSKTRALASFVLFAMILVVPLHIIQGVSSASVIQNAVVVSGESGASHMESAVSALQAQEFELAATDFQVAAKKFQEAQDSLQSLNASVAILVNVIPKTDKTYDTGRNLIIAGSAFAEAANLFSQNAQDINSQNLKLTEKISLTISYLEKTLPYLEKASKASSKIDISVVPNDKQEMAKTFIDTAPRLAQSVEEFITFADTLNLILGADGKQRYLVAFQNNAELRATGGFIGSFAEMSIENGEITNMHIPSGGTYDVQGQLSTFVKAPEPLSLINPRWEFHDINWFPNYPSSAEKMLSFYEKAGGPTLDGVISINANILPELLAIVGPIEMEQYGRTINSENVLFEMQKIVEFEFDEYKDEDNERKEDAPKAFVGDLMEILLTKFESADFDTLLAVASILGNGFSEKDLLVYFRDNALQSQIHALDWSGEIKQTAQDYLMVVNTNIGGGKTDSIIDQDIDVQVEIQDNGSIINNVTITKTHRGIKQQLFEGKNNVDYIRLYVPEGSRLLSADGFEIPPQSLFEKSDLNLKIDPDLEFTIEDSSKDEESHTDIWTEEGKTVFGNWMQTAPGEVEIVHFSYLLPFTIEAEENDTLMKKAKARLGVRQIKPYTLFLQKQPGVTTRKTTIEIDAPSAMTTVWSSHSDIEKGTTFPNYTDTFIRMLFDL